VASSSHDEALVRRFAACRDRGDVAGAKRVWEELVVNNADRVRGIAATWPKAKLSPDEREDAASRALVKLWRNMVETFHGTTAGEFYAALYRCTEFACLDVHRAGAKAQARDRSLDAEGSDEGLDGYGRWTGDAARADAERAQEMADAAEFVGWALPRMANERARVVVERTLAGVPVSEIMAELRTSDQNVHQLRSRGMKELRELWGEFHHAA
jgi:RNA polymerase sigma factor (sigma-70 family)